MKGRKANKSSWGLPRPCPNCDKKFLRASKWQKYCVSCRDKKWIMRSNKGGSRPKSKGLNSSIYYIGHGK